MTKNLSNQEKFIKLNNLLITYIHDKEFINIPQSNFEKAWNDYYINRNDDNWEELKNKAQIYYEKELSYQKKTFINMHKVSEKILECTATIASSMFFLGCFSIGPPLWVASACVAALGGAIALIAYGIETLCNLDKKEEIAKSKKITNALDEIFKFPPKKGFFSFFKSTDSPRGATDKQLAEVAPESDLDKMPYC